MSDWRLTDHTAAAGLSHAAMWRKGAAKALTNAQADGAEMWGLWLGVVHFVHCLHHLRKCVLMAGGNVPQDVARDIATMVADFDRAVPDLVPIRDILEHYEDGYALGKGNRQQPTVNQRRRKLDPERSEQFRVVPDYLEGETSRPVVRVATFQLELAPAMEEAERMLWALYDRVREL